MTSWHGSRSAVARGDVDSAMRYALGKEQAGALGRAGKRLEAALSAYRTAEAGGGQPGEALARRVAEELWSLLIQREVAGFTADNLAWLRREYDIPERVINRLGVATGPSARLR